MDGYRFTVERNRLCIWLEEETAKLARLPQSERVTKALALEQQFRIRLDALYAKAAPHLKGDAELH